MAIDTYKCPENQCMEIYTVKPGDTLYAISQAYGIPVAQLMQINRILNPYNLKAGQKLCIPAKSPSRPTIPSQPQVPAQPDTPVLPTPVVCSGTTHVIAKGDTLYMIAKRYGVTLDALMKANPQMDPYNLRVGDMICVPMPEDGDSDGNHGGNIRPPMPECYGGKAYATQRGDTLTRILNRFELTYGQLLAANPDIDFTGSLESLTLCIPIVTPENGCMETYTIARGDTLDSISQRFLMLSDRLMMANPELTVKDFTVPGTEICIPK
ncbi:MAG: LysM peptidoglycan-binding domain-containing protein [Firmicutes bacterium]|nr:LysM peptidoglycan-binding domain-containing protein [Bacillota bacterium]